MHAWVFDHAFLAPLCAALGWRLGNVLGWYIAKVLKEFLSVFLD